MKRISVQLICEKIGVQVRNICRQTSLVMGAPLHWAP